MVRVSCVRLGARGEEKDIFHDQSCLDDREKSIEAVLMDPCSVQPDSRILCDYCVLSARSLWLLRNVIGTVNQSVTHVHDE